ncbi:hypothetical protein TWF594_004002 [Orbilia oligospora]|nr:hypothetical protein TWF706_003454 [Orbilia oligospora]KAF3152301.1 hypothetical protein TWF594_004002 [Orbilia oligospora]
MSPISPEVVTICGFCLSAVIISHFHQHIKRYRCQLPKPPLAPLTHHDIVHNTEESIIGALHKYGPVVSFERNGSREYIVDNEYTRKVLTEDSLFSFENGMASLLGINWLLGLHGGTFFRDIDDIMKNFLARRLGNIESKVWPIFERGALALSKASSPRNQIDMLPYAQSTMAEVTTAVFFGEKYMEPSIIKAVIALASDTAEMTGLFQNRSWLAHEVPIVWRLWTWISVVLFKIPLHFGPKFAWRLWSDIKCRTADDSDKDDETVISYLVNRYKTSNGSVSLSSKLWIFVLVLASILGSVHQTSTIIVWATFFLAVHPESQVEIRDELIKITERPLPDIKKALRTDSFIREVLRMKGDTVNVVRASVRDVDLGGYLIPKGSLVFPVTRLSYRSPRYTENPDKFDANRWVGSGKTAATTGLGYLAFGYGKWACPGRFLAVLEVKYWLLALVKCSKFTLEGGRYRVLDGWNVTAVAPEGRLLIEPYSDTLSA